MTNSKLFIIFFFPSFFTLFASPAKCPAKQSEALLLFKHNLSSINYPIDDCYNVLGSDYRPIMMSWNTIIDCCNWDGVSCDDSTGDVIGLDLYCGMLQGTIHPDSSLFNLTHLRHLGLSWNKLNGTLPSWLFTSPSLESLSLNGNMFSGNVPFDSFSLPSLTYLDLTQNHLAGQIDVQTFRQHTNLTDLYLQYNNFSGELELDTLLSSLTNLEILGLSYSGFSLTTKNANHYVNPGFRYLGLASCKLKVFPNSLRAMKELAHLDLSSNEIHGQIPQWAGEIGGTYRLTYVNLSHNIITGLPQFQWYGLEELYLQSNLIEGPFPPSICNMSNLQYLDMSNNRFGGLIPQCFGNISSSLVMSDMGNNSFTFASPAKCPAKQSEALLLFKHNLSSINYPIDDCYSVLGSDYRPIMKSWNTSIDCCNWDGVSCHDSTGDVIGLDLYCGMLQGTIHPDSSLFNLTHLRHLGLSWNKLNGTLPSWLFTSPSLESLSLNGNMFSGNVPFDSFSLPSLTYLDLTQNHLAGQIDVQTFRQHTNLTDLYLQYNNFSGELELDTLLSSLTNLEILGLSYSGFSLTTKNANHYVNPGFRYLGLASCKLKVFPNSLRAMKELAYLDLSSNEIHGQIPHWAGEIGGTHRLRYVNLSHNIITGLPQFQWYGLEELYLQSNLIEGPFPPSICNMSNLKYLDMSNNRFGGLIPQCFGNISSSLVMIDMGNNSFQGTIPNIYWDCGNLEGIILKGNQLEGELPSSLYKCQSLKVVDFGKNHLNGTFPSWLEGLPYLQALVLKSNNFHGHIQPSATVDSPFPNLRVLDLSHNRFVGQLPAKYFQNFNAMKNVVKTSTKPKYLSMGGKYYSFVVAVKGVNQDFPQILVDYTIIDLSNNTFEGQIPNVIGGLNSLIVLNLSHNSLIGPIPHALGNLTEIESLDLSWNQLSGEIPQSLARITTLEVLNLSQNHLVGRIPGGTQFSTFSTSFGGNSGLYGFPLPNHEHRSSPQVEDDGEDDDEEESGFTWKVVMLGYGCGTIIGLVIGYLMLSTTRPNWLNAVADAGEHMILKRRNKRRSAYMGK